MPQLSELEIASGVVFGLDPHVPRLPEVDPTYEPLDALAQALIPLLERPPCVVSFSGGRDSSAVLAVASSVARQEGLEMPIPVTLRFPQTSASMESEWQEAVVRHLAITEWTCIDFANELDLLGPVAQGVLNRHGVLFPTNTHFHVPILEHARGGSVLTGIDGDDLFGGWRWERAAAILGRRRRMGLNDVRHLGLALSPHLVRKQLMRARVHVELPWLRPSAAAEARDAILELSAREPLDWAARTDFWQRHRGLSVWKASGDLVAADYGTSMAHPLADPTFLATLACRGGPHGFGNRTETMQILFRGTLPDAVLQRVDKAGFDGVFWRDHARRFIKSWSGAGIPSEIVDKNALRHMWAMEVPDARSALLLQTAWLHQQRERSIALTA